MNTVIARQLQKMASGIARNLYRGYFDNAAGPDALALETCRDGR